MYSDLIGVPFVNGGRDPKTGLDCYGLAIEVFRRHGIELPDYRISADDYVAIDKTVANERSKWEALQKPEVPSLIVMRFNSPVLINHVGVYIGNGQFIHTARRTGVRIDTIDHPYWKKQIEGYYLPKKR